jgi:hypothetical protein
MLQLQTSQFLLPAGAFLHCFGCFAPELYSKLEPSLCATGTAVGQATFQQRVGLYIVLTSEVIHDSFRSYLDTALAQKILGYRY